MIETYLKVQSRVNQKPEYLQSNFYPVIGNIKDVFASIEKYKHPNKF